MTFSAISMSVLRYGLASTLMISCAPAALHAEPSLNELASEIQALKSENRQMKAAISNMRGETRRETGKVLRAVERHTPAPNTFRRAPPNASRR